LYRDVRGFVSTYSWFCIEIFHLDWVLTQPAFFRKTIRKLAQK